MSRLPAQADVVRSFIEQVAIDGAMAKAIAFMPWLGFFIFKGILEDLLENLIVDPALDFAEAKALAAIYVTNQAAFDKKIIELTLLVKTNPTPQQVEEALSEAQKAMFQFVRRGPALK